jgi:hypothetical protein
MTTTKTLTIDEARDLADDLIRQLSRHPGDDPAVCEVLRHWLDVHGVQGLSLVAMAAMRITFGECLTTHPEAIPSDALTIDTSTRKGHPAHD